MVCLADALVNMGTGLDHDLCGLFYNYNTSTILLTHCKRYLGPLESVFPTKDHQYLTPGETFLSVMGRAVVYPD